jgi:pimeloyl-ACP methyl ester carboxylesterase
LAVGLPAAAAARRKQSEKDNAMAKPSIVFAHGLWADGSCFHKLIPTLQADGHEVICSQHGLDSLKGDVECVTRCFGRVKGPVVLVGHSYGGTLITHAGMDDRVAALVYIAALAPDETETSQGQQQKFPVTDVLSHIEVADGRIWLKPDGVSFFCGDLPKAEQKLVWATQSAPVPDLFMQKLDGVAWRRKPSWYTVSNQDRTVQPELQRSAAKRMGATTVELRSSHVSMLSQPQAVVEVIRNAAAAVSAKRA